MKRPPASSYDRDFAEVYDRYFGFFASGVAPRLVDFCERHDVDRASARVLDVCCGTGTADAGMLRHGFRVVGIDNSRFMIRVARRKFQRFVRSGRARFIVANATDFHVGSQFGFAYSIFDSLNHLANLASLRACLRAVHRSVKPGAFFLFDLLTPAGFEGASTYSGGDPTGGFLSTSGIYDPRLHRSTARIVGFYRVQNGFYRRFSDLTAETAFELADVNRELNSAGWELCRHALWETLETPVRDPSKENRVVFVCRRRR